MFETALCLLVFLGFIFLITDLSMGILAKMTLQHAVRSGVRYAITSQTSGSLGQVASIKQVVQAQSMGFLSASAASTYVTVTFCSVNTNPPVCGLTGVGSNLAGNLVIVSVNAWPFTPIAPVLHSGAAIPLSVSAGDLIESSGSGASPPPL
jgi:Flp pilus assembly protein TadG